MEMFNEINKHFENNNSIIVRKDEDGISLLNKNNKREIKIRKDEYEASDGSVEVTLKFNTTGFTETDTVVVFETILDVADGTDDQLEDIEIAKHEDLSDSDQTISFVQPEIPATGEGIALSTIAGLLLLTGAVTTVIVITRKKRF